MPYIHTKTNLKITEETAEAIKRRLGNAISLFPGKSENWLMITLEGNQKMYFQGEEKPVVFAEVKLFGTPEKSACAAFAKEATGIFDELLGICPDCIYIRFSGTENWSWNGRLF